jgi:hypothetical protein
VDILLSRGTPTAAVQVANRPSSPLTWSSSDPSVARVTDAGLVTAVATGDAIVTASAPGAGSATVRVEVWLPDHGTAWTAGSSYRGRGGYVEYRPGDLPVILAAPHGGDLEPSEIADRTSGVTVTDRNTIELLEALADALEVETGERPHLVVSRLDRGKLDPNRELAEAVESGAPYASLAWEEYHAFLDTARAVVARGLGWGLFLDLHGHGHDVDRVELGYLLSGSELALGDAALDLLAPGTSIRTLVAESGTPLSGLIRGPTAFGTLLAAAGVPAIPSDVDQAPGADPYFTGGYSTRRHGSREGGPVSGIQLEHHFPGLRDTQANREAYAAAAAGVIRTYLETHFGWVAPPAP